MIGYEIILGNTKFRVFDQPIGRVSWELHAPAQVGQTNLFTKGWFVFVGDLAVMGGSDFVEALNEFADGCEPEEDYEQEDKDFGVFYVVAAGEFVGRFVCVVFEVGFGRCERNFVFGQILVDLDDSVIEGKIVVG